MLPRVRFRVPPAHCRKLGSFVLPEALGTATTYLRPKAEATKKYLEVKEQDLQQGELHDRQARV